MFKSRTLRILALLVAAYALILLPGYFNPAYLDSAIGMLLLIPLLSVYLFDQLGVPGLLLNSGACAVGAGVRPRCWAGCLPPWLGYCRCGCWPGRWRRLLPRRRQRPKLSKQLLLRMVLAI